MGINISNETIENNVAQMRSMMESSPKGQQIKEDCRVGLSYKDADGDGKVTVEEFSQYDNDLMDSIFSGNDEYAAKAKEIATAQNELYARYAGEDGILDEAEYNACLQSKENGALLEQYWELRDANDAQNGDNVVGLGRHDNNRDGNVTSGEMLQDDLQRNETLFGDNLSAYKAANDFSIAKAQIFEQYAGDDGILDSTEYTDALKSDEYKKALAEYNQIRTFLN